MKYREKYWFIRYFDNLDDSYREEIARLYRQTQLGLRRHFEQDVYDVKKMTNHQKDFLMNKIPYMEEDEIERMERINHLPFYEIFFRLQQRKQFGKQSRSILK